MALIGLVVVLGSPGLRDISPHIASGWVGLLVGMAAIVIGAWLVIRAVADLGRSLSPMPRPRPDGRLIDTGIYARLRHPIYAGVIFASFGWSVLTGSLGALVAALLLAIFLDAKARREEIWLLERYDAYADYRQRSKRFLPGIY
ncbi:MAG TPA: isoprenylcysteine carboxylmethyltransferase family protein [Candidatus Limnocylindria bacterium]